MSCVAALAKTVRHDEQGEITSLTRTIDAVGTERQAFKRKMISGTQRSACFFP